jgi:hypothetical protein
LRTTIGLHHKIQTKQKQNTTKNFHFNEQKKRFFFANAF